MKIRQTNKLKIRQTNILKIYIPTNGQTDRHVQIIIRFYETIKKKYAKTRLNAKTVFIRDNLKTRHIFCIL